MADGSGEPPNRAVVYDDVVVRYYRPAAALGEFVVDYGIYDSGPPGRHRANTYPPGIANLCILIGGGAMQVRIRNRFYPEAPRAMLFGPTSHAMRVDSDGGRLVGMGITPLGWSRLFDRAASATANRLLPLSELWGVAAAGTIHARLSTAGSDAEVVETLNAFLAARLGPATKDESLIAALARLVLDPAVEESTTAAERMGVPVPTLRRLANSYFGFPPKLLMRRARFIRALVAVAVYGERADFARFAPSYYDRSHFIRDAQLFLGMTARRFASEMTPLMRAMIEGRRRTFDQPMQSLIG